MSALKRLVTHLGDDIEIGGCAHPVTIDKHDGYGKQTFGCGKCAYCRAKIRNAWNFRLNREYTYNAQYAAFCTLTYDDDHLSGYFDKRACQLFLKRLRKNLYELSDGTVRLKYYFTSEFGSRTYRPHHHCLFFLYDGAWFKNNTTDHLEFRQCGHFYDFPGLLPLLVSRHWHFGYTLAEPVNSPRINYITHYHSRPKKPDGVPSDARDPWVISSTRLGVFDVKHDVVFRNGVPMVFNTFDGLWITLPPYYRKKFDMPIVQDRQLAPTSYYLSDQDVLYLKKRDRQIDKLYNTESF